ncbi:acyl-CoA dehydrogenase family protein [Sphingosinicella rhizophila]|uniref:Acyl-CoA dehydrogenase family protein n=1 Tax=Sphingosinicella rhizophila TaxID=3050082 RepID=A0ABU3Q5M8_9SPHN|nr:acyl-CoA dehydrogenase family protein [Sphingosinicella sp. GR2756]MDT9598719.1 acyl-CoA dehydrogenase family protein [Sphingosinicella sp. GR2756]
MNFDFSDEQRELQRSARGVLEKECTTAKVRRVLEGDDGFDREIWSTIAEMGFCGAAIPEEFGGLGLGYLELCVIAEELGRALAPVPFDSTVCLFAELLKLAGSDAQKALYLPRVAEGKLIGTLAQAETRGAAAGARAAVSGGKLSGTKCPVMDGGSADIAIVVAFEEQDAAPTLFLVDLSSEGVERTAVETLDPSRKHALLRFGGAPAERLGARGEAVDILGHVYDRAAVLVAFQQVGGAERALELARDYALQRVAFGRPIGSFQAIKHMLADMFVSLTIARANTYYAAWALQSDSAELPAAAAAARVSATTAFQHCSTNNIQVHGGIGFTWEFDSHLFYRRSNLLALSLGSQSQWEAKLVDRMRTRKAV